MKLQERVMEETIHIRDLDIHCQWVNLQLKTPGKPVLVFLHEGLGSIGQWKSFPRELSELLQIPALVYDRYGYGKSSALREKRDVDYLHKEAEEFLPHIVQHYQLDQLILFGHSDGGSIALIYAALFPGHVKAVITEAAHVFVEDISIEGIEDAADYYERSDRFRKALSKYHGEKTDSIFYGWSDTWRLQAFRDWNIEELLPDISCPVLAIQGKEDEYGTVEQVNRISSKVPSGKKLIIPDCKHIPHHQQKEKVLKASKYFIDNEA